MTNREYFEKNNISFNEVLKEFNKNKFKSFDDFLNTERTTYKFNIGDIIVMDCSKLRAKANDWKHNVVFRVKGFKGNGIFYTLEFLTLGNERNIGYTSEYSARFIDEVCKFY